MKKEKKSVYSIIFSYCGSSYLTDAKHDGKPFGRIPMQSVERYRPETNVSLRPLSE